MVDEIVNEPEVYINNTIDFSLKADLSFLSVLVQEGDLLNAITIACVFWKFLKDHSQSVKEVRRWIRCYLEILLSEEMLEEMVIIRNIVATLNMAVDKDYVLHNLTLALIYRALISHIKPLQQKICGIFRGNLKYNQNRQNHQNVFLSRLLREFMNSTKTKYTDRRTSRPIGIKIFKIAGKKEKRNRLQHSHAEKQRFDRAFILFNLQGEKSGTGCDVFTVWAWRTSQTYSGVVWECKSMQE